MREPVAGQQWIDGLEPPRQRAAIDWLADWSRDHADVSSFSVGCSIGRGAADDLSDVDGAIGVRAVDAIHPVEEALVAGLPAIGEVVDVLRSGRGPTGVTIRRVFVQYADRLQLDLALVPESAVRRGSAAPDFVTLYRASDVPDPTPAPSAYDVDPALVDEWEFAGWLALLDADKYLRRDSPWEAHQRLEEVRQVIWRLWAVARGTSYPQHGLTQVLDECPADLPPGIDRTVAGLDLRALRTAVEAAADVLGECAAAIGDGRRERPLGAYVRGVLGV